MSASCDLVMNYSDEVLVHSMNLPFLSFSSGKGTRGTVGELFLKPS